MKAVWPATMCDDPRPLNDVPAQARFYPAKGAGLMTLQDLLTRLFTAKEKGIPQSDGQWHEIEPPLYRSLTLVDGRRSLSTGKLWRRATPAGTWEYRQDPETCDDFLDRQW